MYSPTFYPRQRWTYPKDEEKNVVAAFFHLITIIFICISLIEMNWFRIWAGLCTPHLSTNQFFGFGEFYATTPKQYYLWNSTRYVIHYNSSEYSLACVTPEIANLMYILVILSIFAVISSFMGFCMDIIGPSQQYLKVLRRNAVPSITTVFIIISIIGTCYFVTRSLITSIQEMNIQTDIQITYDYGCYGVTAAGSFSILATACNLLQTPSPVEHHQGHARLIEDWDGPETFSVGMRNIPHPPPPYTP